MKPIAICLLLSATMFRVTHADVILDQQHFFSSATSSSTNGDVSEIGQTFTVGVAGTLDHIDVLMFRLGDIFDPTGDPLLRVYNTVGGLPSGSPLATTVVPEALVPLNAAAFVSFDVSSAGIGLNVGDLFAFSVTATSGIGPYFLLVETDNNQPSNYLAGAGIAKFGANPWQTLVPPQDHGFRTFVNAVPEPSSLACCLWIGVAMVRRKRTHRIQAAERGRTL